MSAAARPLPRLFDAAWMGFDTGRFPDPDPSGFGPTSMAAGDMNGDGTTDIVVGHGYSAGPGVSVLLGLGGATFGRPAYYPLPWNDSVGRVVLFDMDADGDLDVAATIPNAWDLGTDIASWRNDGTGILSGPARHAVGNDPIGIAAGDVTGDGRPDLLTADAASGSVTLLEHDGNSGPAASFLTARPIAIGGAPRYVRLGDVDGDRDLDLVVSRMDVFNPVVTVLRGDGAGGFGSPRDIVTDPGGPAAIALGDMDGDLDLDLVIGGQQVLGRDAVRILGNDGAGNFGSTADNATTGAPRTVDIALADINGDGRLDVAGVSPNGRESECWSSVLSDGGGGYLPGSIYPTSQNSEAVLAFDADGDGDADVATLAKFSSAVAVYRNPGDGAFFVPARHPVDGTPRGIDSADIDGDGDLDVVTAAATMQIHRNASDGTFLPPEAVPNPTGMTTIEGVRLRDMDGDGARDLLMSPGGNGRFAVARNRGDGTFLPATQWSSDSCGGGTIDAFDLDRDGDLDVVMADCADGFGYYVLVARNDGTASFVNQPHVPIQLTANAVAADDTDGDGTPDLILNETGMGIAVLHGNGDLTFGPEVFSVTGTPPLTFAIDDFNGDDIPDAGVVTGQGSAGTDYAGIALGQGDGTFADPVLESGSSTLEPLRLTDDADSGDADCDGRPDLVVTYYASNDLGLFVANADGTLQPQVRYGAANVPGITTLGDFDGDGHLDIATVALPVSPCCGYALLVLRGQCACVSSQPGPPGEPTRLMVSRAASALSFSWQAPVPAATSYRLVRGTIGTWYDHRSDDPAGAGACSVASESFVDADDAAWSGASWYYLVLGVGDCPDLVGSAGYGWDRHAYFPRPGPRPTASCP